MNLAARLVLAVALTALFSVTLTGVLSYRAASDRVPRAFGMTMGPRGAGPTNDARPMPGAASVTALLGELQGATVQAAAIALAVALAAGGWLAWQTSRPIARIAEVTRRYGAGERRLRAPVTGPGEVATLARVFNDTADRLSAEEAQRQRFTTDIAHELRTPLTVLKSELEAIEDGLMQADPETVGLLLQQVDLLARLVQDLRTLTLAEAGALTLRRDVLDLGPWVDRTVRTFGSRAAANGVRLEVDAGTEPFPADVDAERLQQVVNALLDNALRHTPSGGAIAVKVARSGPIVVVDVLDDGPGIPPESLPFVFERFYRADPSRDRASGGSGLGLSIAAAIVRLHDGALEARRRPEGGAWFQMRLPLAGAGDTGPSSP